MANIYLNKDSTHSYMIETTSASVVPFSVKAAGSQTANLQEWQNSSGTVLTSITKDGDIDFGNRTANILFNNHWYMGTATNGFQYYNNIGALYGTFYFGKYVFKNVFTVSQEINWSSDAFNVAADVGIDRSAAGILKLTNASSGNGSLILGAYSSSTKPLTIKGASSQTAVMTEWQNSSGTALAWLDANWYLYLTGGLQLGGYKLNLSPTGDIDAINDCQLRLYTTHANGMVVRSKTTIGNSNEVGAANVPLTIKGSASQTANLQVWQNSSGTVLSRITSAGRFDIMNAAGSSAIGSFYNNGDISTFHTDVYNIAADGSTNVVSTEIYMSPSFALNWSATTLGSRDVGLKRDTTNRLKLTNGSTGYGQLKLAYPVINQNSAPADGDLAANECSIWFDSTNGAAFIRFKGKSADGTVVTGSLALT